MRSGEEAALLEGLLPTNHLLENLRPQSLHAISLPIPTVTAERIKACNLKGERRRGKLCK